LLALEEGRGHLYSSTAGFIGLSAFGPLDIETPLTFSAGGKIGEMTPVVVVVVECGSGGASCITRDCGARE